MDQKSAQRVESFNPCPKGLTHGNPFCRKVVFYCWPYAPSLIHVVSASATVALEWKRGEYSSTGPATIAPMRCANCCFGKLQIATRKRADKFSCDQF
jgi:hypothetical protein